MTECRLRPCLARCSPVSAPRFPPAEQGRLSGPGPSGREALLQPLWALTHLRPLARGPAGRSHQQRAGLVPVQGAHGC